MRPRAPIVDADRPPADQTEAGEEELIVGLRLVLSIEICGIKLSVLSHVIPRRSCAVRMRESSRTHEPEESLNRGFRECGGLFSLGETALAQEDRLAHAPIELPGALLAGDTASTEEQESIRGRAEEPFLGAGERRPHERDDLRKAGLVYLHRIEKILDDHESRGGICPGAVQIEEYAVSRKGRRKLVEALARGCRLVERASSVGNELTALVVNGDGETILQDAPRAVPDAEGYDGHIRKPCDADTRVLVVELQFTAERRVYQHRAAWTSRTSTAGAF